MNSLREKQKQEAIERLKLMGIHEDVWKQFEESNTVMLCRSGQHFPLTEEEENEVRLFELEYDTTVYLAVRWVTVFGTLDALLFVGKYEEEWEMEQADIRNGYAMSYCINRDYPECSEMGSICFRITEDGGIVREG